MLGKHHPPARIERQAIGAGLAASEREPPSITAWPEKHALALARFPLVDRIPHYVGEEQVLSVGNPKWSLYPTMVVDDLLQDSTLRNQTVEFWPQPPDHGPGCRGRDLGR